MSIKKLGDTSLTKLIQLIKNKFDSLTKSDVGLDKVDNTSDLDKPISTATQGALNTITTNVGNLQNQMKSFEETKSDLVSSALGGALSLTPESKWAEVITAILGVADNGQSQTAKGISISGSNLLLTGIPEGYYGPSSGNLPEVKISASNLGNATAAQIFTGYTASSKNGVNIAGTLPNKGNLDWAPSGSTSYTVKAGYYTGGTLNSANAYNAGKSAGITNIGIFTITSHSAGVWADNNGATRTLTFGPYPDRNLLLVSGFSFNHGGTPTGLSVVVNQGSIAAQNITLNNALVSEYTDRAGGVKVFTGFYLLNANTKITVSMGLGGGPGGGYISINRLYYGF